MSVVRTPAAQAWFCHIDKPAPRSPGGEPEYTVMLVFDERAQRTAQYQILLKAIEDVKRKKFGSNMDDRRFAATVASCIRDGASRDNMPEGCTFINAHSTSQPSVALRTDDKDYAVEAHDIGRTLFSGCIVGAEIYLHGYDVNKNRGVSPLLNSLLIIDRNVPRLDGRRSAVDSYRGVKVEGYEAPARNANRADVDEDEDAPF